MARPQPLNPTSILEDGVQEPSVVGFNAYVCTTLPSVRGEVIVPALDGGPGKASIPTCPKGYRVVQCPQGQRISPWGQRVDQVSRRVATQPSEVHCGLNREGY